MRSADSTIRARFLFLSPIFYERSCTPATSDQGVRSDDLAGQTYGLRGVGCEVVAFGRSRRKGEGGS